MAHGQAHIDVYEKRNAMLGVEFDRYVRAHPSFAARIPRGAQVVLQIPGDTKFNTWARRLAERQREVGQPAVQVMVERLQAPRSRLVSPRLQIAAA
jgi:hypothetical protein